MSSVPTESRRIILVDVLQEKNWDFALQNLRQCPACHHLQHPPVILTVQGVTEKHTHTCGLYDKIIHLNKEGDRQSFRTQR